MAPVRRWHILLLTCLYIDVFQTYGEEFSLCFIRHFGKEAQQKLILVGLGSVVRINVTRMFDSSTTAVTLLSNQRHVIDLTSSDTNLRSVAIEHKGIKVTTSGRVHILGYDMIKQSTDIFIPREHSHLGRYYAALTHSQDGKPCLIGIVAVKQAFETTVSIILPDTLSELLDYNGHKYTGGDVICLKLTYQQTFQLISNSDLSGAVILSDANLAMFTGAGKVNVYTSDTTDHLVDAVPPVKFWGTHYFLVKIDNKYTDYVKIIASVDNTVIIVSDCFQQTTFTIGTAFIDNEAFTMECDFNYISADKDILVGHFIRRINENPSLYFPLPMKHFAASYVVSSPPLSIYQKCKLVLIATSGASVIYNRIKVLSPWTSIQSTDYRFTSFIVPTCCVGNTVEDKNGLPFWGYLQCTGQDTTAATALMPSSYDMLKVPLSTSLRPEDIAATDKCTTTAAPLSDFVSTVVPTTTAETSIDNTSTHVAESTTVTVQNTTEFTANYDTTTVLPDNFTDNRTSITAGNDATTSSIVYNNSHSTIHTLCPCSLGRKNKLTNMTIADLQKFLQAIRSELLIKKNETSAWKRKLISAKDDRPSSKGIGILGSLLLSFVVGIIVLIDVSNYCLIFKRRKIHCHPS